MKVPKGDLHSLDVAALVVHQAMFLEECLDARRYDGHVQLRHGGEQVVLDLEVEVAHPPINEVEWPWRYVHRVDGCVAHPVHLMHSTAAA